MNIDHPHSHQIPGLRRLWQEAFGDSDAFLDGFFRRAFDPARCLCMTEREEILAALYWFDTECGGLPMAYVYAVATAKAHRGKGHCHALMDALNTHLKDKGYAAALLVPGDESLAALYRSMGYCFFGGIQSFSCLPLSPAVSLRQVAAEEYAHLRRRYLPEGSVIQEGENLSFLETYTELYAGADLLLTVYREGTTAIVLELLGDSRTAPHILAALGAEQGTFRIPGKESFAMWLPFLDVPAPAYFGLAFD